MEQKKIFVNVGQTYQSVHGEFEVVISGSDARSILVEFKDTGSMVNTTVYRIRQGTVKDPAKIKRGRPRKVQTDV
ncbi:hypothetical protein [Atlantibacter hermannii]|uniref:hypothetical protein n=1 Tax=Atlantibacter hermannii TaxID=565 RepID=UPI0028ADD5FF|nr:hypothetical protein [Atlantibacter hermannii]